MGHRGWLVGSGLTLLTMTALSAAGTLAYSWQLDGRVAALRSSVEAGAASSPRNVALAEEFQARFRVLDDELEALAPYQSALGTPASWSRDSEESRILEAALLVRLEPILCSLHELLESASCRELLDSPTPCAPEMSKFMRVRNWANLLGARAVYEARSNGDVAAAASSLADALDLARVLDRGDIASNTISFTVEGITLDAARIVLDAAGPEAGSECRRLLAPRLERALPARTARQIVEMEAWQFCRLLEEARDRSCWSCRWNPARWRELAYLDETLDEYEEHIQAAPNSDSRAGASRVNKLSEAASRMIELRTARIRSGLAELER
jgi:hypothetical protein